MNAPKRTVNIHMLAAALEMALAGLPDLDGRIMSYTYGYSSENSADLGASLCRHLSNHQIANLRLRLGQFTRADQEAMGWRPEDRAMYQICRQAVALAETNGIIPRED